MFGTKELDDKNNYRPDLDNINESAERTYGEANSFFKKEELYLKEIERQIISGELSSEKQIYDECHAIASDLAKCCEMYLKALYLYEHREGNLKCSELWDILEGKMREDKTKDDGRARDQNGNIIYFPTETDQYGNEKPKHYPDGTPVYLHLMVDSSGQPIRDDKGNLIYVDKFGNKYEEKRKGKAVKTNGHALDRLIKLISPYSRMLLETRMLTIPKETTEKNGSVSQYDMLQIRGLLNKHEYISQDQYEGWLDKHKRTFEESRYSGQKEYDVSVEFMYHLTTQIRAVVQWVMHPNKTQQEIYKMDQIMSDRENTYTYTLYYMVKNYKQLKKSGEYIKYNKTMMSLFEIAEIFQAIHLSSEKVYEFLNQFKEIFNVEIGSKSFFELLSIILKNYIASFGYDDKFNNIVYEFNNINDYQEIHKL